MNNKIHNVKSGHPHPRSNLPGSVVGLAGK